MLRLRGARFTVGIRVQIGGSAALQVQAYRRASGESVVLARYRKCENVLNGQGQKSETTRARVA